MFKNKNEPIIKFFNHLLENMLNFGKLRNQP